MADTAKPTRVLAPISVGELLDKISILEIKVARIRDAAKRDAAQHELDQLNTIRSEVVPDTAFVADEYAQMRAVNEALWEIEDRIRLKEHDAAFDAEFIELARSVYITNDKRAAIKLKINRALGSDIVEVKDYA